VIAQRDIVLLSFPFSNLQSANVRPAIVMTNEKYNRSSEDFVAVPLTSNLRMRDQTLLITNRELESGNLVVDSKAKVDRIFSVSQSLVRMKIGRVKVETYERITKVLFNLVGTP
jgi:mRNA interferase MazF